MSRVLAKPGTGALARIAIATGSFIAVAMRELFRIGTEEKREAQPPHQKDGGENAILLPAAAGRHDEFTQAQRPTHALEPLAQRNVFHQWDCRETACGMES